MEPIPPVLRPISLSPILLKSCACGMREISDPLQNPITDTSVPINFSSIKISVFL